MTSSTTLTVIVPAAVARTRGIDANDELSPNMFLTDVSGDSNRVRVRTEAWKRRIRSRGRTICFHVDVKESRDLHEKIKPSVDYAFSIIMVREGNLIKGQNFITNAEANVEYRLSNDK